MMSIKISLQQLEARLPELEWKLNTLPVMPLPHQLPKGLFQERLERTAQSYIYEIKADLSALSQQRNERCAQYIAERVSQKINVLVRFCQQTTNPKPVETVPVFGIQELNTRQQWLKNLHKECEVLRSQRQALQNTLTHHAAQKQEVFLKLQKELGIVERRLTLAEEHLARMTASM